MEDSTVALFESANIRKVMFEGEWWFAVVDVVAVLTDSDNPPVYWRRLKQKLRGEGSKIVQGLNTLRLPSAKDGKRYSIDCANSELLLRLIQSIPSPNAEPFKLWLAQVGQERVEEANNPEQAFLDWRERAILAYVSKGYSRKWAEARLESIMVRNDLTQEWTLRGIDTVDFDILTNTMHTGSLGISIQQHAEMKGYEIVIVKKKRGFKGNLRDGMTVSELAVIITAEATARALHDERESEGYDEILRDVVDAGEAGAATRRIIEAKTGKPVVSARNMAIDKDGGLWGPLLDDDDL